MDPGAPKDVEIEAAASSVNNVVVASLGASIAVSVGTTIGSTVVASTTSAAAGAAGAATGSAGGGAAGATGGPGAGGAGGIAGVVSALMAMQRLSMLASMPVGVSKLHARVGEALAWSKGGLSLSPLLVSEETSQYWGWGDQPIGGLGVGAAGKELEAKDAGDHATTNNGAEGAEKNEQLQLRNALKSLVDTTCTLACALAVVTSTTTH